MTQRDTKDLAEHIRLHEQAIRDQKVVNLRLADRVKALEEEVKFLTLADERRKYELYVVTRKVLPEGSKERAEACLGSGKWLFATKAAQQGAKKSYHPHSFELSAQKDTIPGEQLTRDQQQVQMLMKRPPRTDN